MGDFYSLGPVGPRLELGDYAEKEVLIILPLLTSVLLTILVIKRGWLDNAFVDARWARRPLPLLTAVACCFAHDLSFPTAWYDFDQSDDEGAALAAAAARRPWAARRERAHFRGSVYWYENHGRTRAFAASLVSPDEVDVDWYEKVDTAALETDDPAWMRLREVAEAAGGVLVVPVGEAWAEEMKAGNGKRLYARDGSHPSAAGVLHSAGIFYRFFFGE